MGLAGSHSCHTLPYLAAQDAVAFMWHFADGSTSARPYLGGAAAACAKDAFDPFTQPEVVGCSLYSDTDGGAAVHLDLRQGEGGGGGAALLEAAWLAVAKLLPTWCCFSPRIVFLDFRRLRDLQ